MGGTKEERDEREEERQAKKGGRNLKGTRWAGRIQTFAKSSKKFFIFQANPLNLRDFA